MEGVKSVLYSLAVITSVACTVLLVREYLRTRLRLLLWAGLCFVAFSINNIVLLVDLVIFPDADLRILRLSVSLAGMLFLLYGFVWDAEA